MSNPDHVPVALLALGRPEQTMWLLEAGWEREAVADLFDVDMSTVYSYTSRGRTPSRDELQERLEELGRPLDDSD